MNNTVETEIFSYNVFYALSHVDRYNFTTGFFCIHIGCSIFYSSYLLLDTWVRRICLHKKESCGSERYHIQWPYRRKCSPLDAVSIIPAKEECAILHVCLISSSPFFLNMSIISRLLTRSYPPISCQSIERIGKPIPHYWSIVTCEASAGKPGKMQHY